MYNYEVVFNDGNVIIIEADSIMAYGTGEACFTVKGPYTPYDNGIDNMGIAAGYFPTETVAVVRDYKSIRRGEGS